VKKRAKARPRAAAKVRPSSRAAKPAKARKALATRPTRRPAATARPAARAAKPGAAARPASRLVKAPKPAPRQTKIPEASALDRPRPEPPTALRRSRRTLPDDERLEDRRIPGGLPDERLLSSVRTGRDEIKQMLREHTESSPALTGGDVDAKWQDAYAIGDEAPGDNPTPDQDRVDEIGKALGITYADDQELEGGDEIGERDRQRWELDPASSEDWPHDRDEK
jgi:hypothetical protein